MRRTLTACHDREPLPAVDAALLILEPMGLSPDDLTAATGDDPELDTLILRLHTETACRRRGALAPHPADLDREQCLIPLREKDETLRWQPVSPPSWPPWRCTPRPARRALRLSAELAIDTAGCS